LVYDANNQLSRLIQYLGSSKDLLVEEAKIIEDLELLERDVKENLREGVNRGLIDIKMVTFCENCGEDVQEIKMLEKAIGREETCKYCGETFTITEDNVRCYYSLTFKGIDMYSKLLKKTHFLVPKLKLFPYFVDLWRKKFGNKVLKDYFIVIMLHFLRDLIPFVETLKKFGAKPDKCYFICKPYPYAYKDQISYYLRIRNYHIKIAESFDEIPTLISVTLKEVQQRIEKEKGRLIIVEDGGYIAPILHTNFEKLVQFCEGIVEQTTKGIRKDEKIQKKKVPILNVAECDFKKEYEPQFVASTVVHNIRNMLPDKNFTGKYALVIGYGAIGSKISLELAKSLNMKVYVAEKDPKALLQASNEPLVARVFPPDDIKNYIGDCMLIIGTTGTQSIGKAEVSLLKHGAILVSASSDRDEINVEELELLAGGKENMEDVLSTRDSQKIGTLYKLERLDSRQILLLGDGYPINFYYSESVSNESFDPILTVLFRSILELATKPRIHAGINLKIVNEFVLKEKIREETLRFYRSIILRENI
jgi:S-adenosylhomocysteine hydrolase